MEIVKLISEWKKQPSLVRCTGNGTDKFFRRLGNNEKMVQAIVKFPRSGLLTRHIAVSR